MGTKVYHKTAKRDGGRDDWETPDWVIADVKGWCGQICLDLAANSFSVRGKMYIAGDSLAPSVDWVRAAENARSIFGDGICWLNPPYSNAGDWMKKAHESANRGCKIVALVASRTSNVWWHDYCLHWPISYFRGRLVFKGAPTGAPFPSALVFFGFDTRPMPLSISQGGMDASDSSRDSR